MRFIIKQLAHLYAWFKSYNRLDLFPVRHFAKRYQKDKAAADLRAGFNVALLAFPQGMAYALIAGIPIQYGIYGSAVATIVGTMFSGSRFITLGPTNATSVLLLSAFAALNIGGEDKLMLLPLLIGLVGLFLVVGAYLGVASLIQYISRTVVTGYITAASFLIMANQVKTALGFSFSDGEQATNFFEVSYLTLSHIGETHWPTVVASIIAASIYLVLRRFLPTFPNVALTLILMAFVTMGLNAIEGWNIVMLAGVDASSWKITPPPLNVEAAAALSSSAIAIALLAVLEGSSIGKSLAARAGSRIDANQEMFSTGMANIGCAFFSGMPASGSLTRSALAIESGAKTTFTSLFSGLMVAAGAFALGPFIAYIPQAALSVVVIFIALSLLNRHQIRIVTTATMSDRITFFVTFLSGMLLALDTAIYMGAATSIALFLRKVSKPEMVEYGFDKEGQLTELQDKTERSDPEVSIVHVEGELFFGAAELFRDQMRRIGEDPNLKIIILKVRNTYRLDASAIMALEELIRYMNSKGRYIIISEARKDAIRVIKNSGLLDLLERRNLIPDVTGNPTLSTARALRRAKEQLKAMGEQDAKVTIYVDDKKVADEGEIKKGKEK